MENQLFTVALGLQPPWEVQAVRFDPTAGEIELEVGFTTGARFACPRVGPPNSRCTTPESGAGVT